MSSSITFGRPSELPQIRTACLDDAPRIMSLYRRVARAPVGLARSESEITPDVVERFIGASLARGIILVAESEQQLVGEIHAYRPDIACFSHLLTDLTVAVDPDAQSRGLGRELFETLMDLVVHLNPDVQRVELFARRDNRRALTFYQSMDFSIEGTLERRVMNDDGTFEADILMAWLRNPPAGE